MYLITLHSTSHSWSSIGQDPPGKYIPNCMAPSKRQSIPWDQMSSWKRNRHTDKRAKSKEMFHLQVQTTVSCISSSSFMCGRLVLIVLTELTLTRWAAPAGGALSLCSHVIETNDGTRTSGGASAVRRTYLTHKKHTTLAGRTRSSFCVFSWD